MDRLRARDGLDRLRFQEVIKSVRDFALGSSDPRRRKHHQVL